MSCCTLTGNSGGAKVSNQQALPMDVERVAKRSTSRVVRRPIAEALVKSPEHADAYRAVLDYCSHGVVGIGPFEAEALVTFVERAHKVESGGHEFLAALAQALDRAGVKPGESFY